MADIEPPPIERGPIRYRVTTYLETFLPPGPWPRWCWKIQTDLGSRWAWWDDGHGVAWTEAGAAKKANRALAKRRREDRRRAASEASERTWEVES